MIELMILEEQEKAQRRYDQELLRNPPKKTGCPCADDMSKPTCRRNCRCRYTILVDQDDCLLHPRKSPGAPA